MSEKFKACSVEGCDKSPKRRGFCIAHYTRLLRHGDPLGGGTPQGEPMRFIHEVALGYEGDDCLTWPFSRIANGYGNVNVDGKMQYAHRHICKLVHGEPPTPEHEAAHSCGNGHLACVNPNHLSWKTRVGNMADKLIHGTHGRGEQHGQAKLTEAQAREILALKGAEVQRVTAERFGVTFQTVSDIQRGKNWHWIQESDQ